MEGVVNFMNLLRGAQAIEFGNLWFAGTGASDCVFKKGENDKRINSPRNQHYITSLQLSSAFGN
jgi:hypothetical protein